MFYLDSSVVKSVLRIGIFVNLILLAIVEHRNNY